MDTTKKSDQREGSPKLILPHLIKSCTSKTGKDYSNIPIIFTISADK